MGTIARFVGPAMLAGTLLATSPDALSRRPALAAEAQSPASASFRILGAVERPETYRLQDLRAKPRTTLEVYFNTGAGPVTATFKGVLLWTLLEDAGIRANPAVRNDILRRTVRLTATDGYQVVLGVGEIAPAFGGEQAIIAYEQDGAPLPAADGFARLVMPGDKAGGRNIFALARIEVR